MIFRPCFNAPDLTPLIAFCPGINLRYPYLRCYVVTALEQQPGVIKVDPACYPLFRPINLEKKLSKLGCTRELKWHLFF